MARTKLSNINLVSKSILRAVIIALLTSIRTQALGTSGCNNIQERSFVRVVVAVVVVLVGLALIHKLDKPIKKVNVVLNRWQKLAQDLQRSGLVMSGVRITDGAGRPMPPCHIYKEAT